MLIEKISSSHMLWERVKEYAANCSWSAGKALSHSMSNGVFTDWEGVIIAREGQKICGYCAVVKKDCIPEVPYTPYISWGFVDEAFRGNRLSQELIVYAMEYLKKSGFNKVYLVSDHINLYEKYGFQVIDKKMAPWGAEEKIYMQELVDDSID